MRPVILKLFLLFFFSFFTCPTVVFSAESDHLRIAEINRILDIAEQRISMKEDYPSQSSVIENSEIDVSDHGSSGGFHDFFNFDSPLIDFQMGFETSFIRYAEPNLMKQKGHMHGIWALYRHRFSDNRHIESWDDIWNDRRKISMFQWDGKVSWGQVDYESEGTGTADGIDDFMFETRFIAGYEIPFLLTRVTPYGGIGYRYLFNESGGRQTSTGHYGYDRQANYYYVPIGLELVQDLSKGWRIETTLEYDWFIEGRQVSHLEDVPAPAGFTSYDTLKNTQEKGYGLRGSFKIQRETAKLDLFFEPFIRYWSIEDSETQPITLDGNFISAGPGLIFVGLEPKNNSTEYGMKLGGHF